MTTKNDNRINEMYQSVRDRLIRKMERENPRVDPGDLIDNAYLFVFEDLQKLGDSVTAKKVVGYVYHRAYLDMKSASRASKLLRGRRSVRPQMSLDVEPDLDHGGEFRRDPVEAYSYSRYCENLRADEADRCAAAKVTALKTVLYRHFKARGIGKRTQRIIVGRVLEERDVADLAGEFSTSVNYISRKASEGRRMILDLKGEIMSECRRLMAG